MDLFGNSIGFVSPFCRLCCPHPSFSPFVSGSLSCWILLNQLPIVESFIYWTQRHKDAEFLLKEKNSVPLCLCVRFKEFGSLGVFAACSRWSVDVSLACRLVAMSSSKLSSKLPNS
jgi:hypothetical protein